MNHPNFVAASLVAAVAALASADALASPPQLCRSGDGRNGYDQGHQLQERSLRAAFSRHFTCNSLESFLHAVRVDFPGSSTRDRFLQCRDRGIVDGMNETLNAIASECNQQCTDSGDSIGTNAATQYCRILEEKSESDEGWTSTPLPLCAIATEGACRAAFTGFVNNHSECRRKADQDRFYDQTIDDNCKLLTGGRR